MSDSQDKIISKLKKKANRIFAAYLKGELTYPEAMKLADDLSVETSKSILKETIDKVRSFV